MSSGQTEVEQQAGQTVKDADGNQTPLNELTKGQQR